MDEASELATYLPIALKTPAEVNYIDKLWKAFEGNYSGAHFQFAFLAYHMLMMSFVYFKLWQVRNAFPVDFEKGLIGFARDEDRECLRTASPFAFSKVNERAVLRLLGLIGCDDAQIGNYKKLVGDRNEAAHANGNVFFSSRREIDQKIRQVLQSIREIQSHSEPVIDWSYKEFLIQGNEPDEREFLNAEDQVREILVHRNYLSLKDVENCANYDVSELFELLDGPNVESLHRSLQAAY